MSGQNMESHRPYIDPGFCIDNISKSTLNNLSNFKRNALTGSWMGSYYYVKNVNRARVKRCIQNKLLKSDENNF